MTKKLATHLFTATFGAVIALSLVAIGGIFIGAVSADSNFNLACVDSNGNGVIDRSEVIDVIRAYFDETRVSLPEPPPGLGSRGNPVPFETALEVRNSETDHWEVSVLETTPDATAAVLEENRFNDPPEAGNQFFIAKVRAKYLGPDSTSFDGSLRLKALGDGGVVYTTFANSCGVIPNGLPNPELFTNGTIEGNVCWQIAYADVDSLLMMLDREFLSTEGNRVWFSLRE